MIVLPTIVLLKTTS